MNSIQNYGMPNYQLGFKSKQKAGDILKQQLDIINATRCFRESYEPIPEKVIKELKKVIKEHIASGKKLDLEETLKTFVEHKPTNIMSPDGDVLLLKNFDSSTKEKIAGLFKKGLKIGDIEAQLNLIRCETPKISK